MSNEIVIGVSERIGSKRAISNTGAECVYEQICGIIDRKGVVVLDFAGIELIVTAFLNTAIGKLYGKYDEAKIEASLRFHNLDNDDMEMVSEVKKRAKSFFADTRGFSDKAEEALH